MLLKDYILQLHKVIAEYTQTGLLVSSNFGSDIRTESIGAVKGEIGFADGSRLFFREYLDLRYGIDKIMYSYHYQDIEDMLRFRYDNAEHRPRLDVRDHRHSPAKIEATGIPTLEDILLEITNNYLT